MFGLGRDHAGGAGGAHLRHAPGVDHLNAMIVLEGLQHHFRARRAADEQALQTRCARTTLRRVIKVTLPHRGHAAADCRAMAHRQFAQRRAVEPAAGQDQAGACHRHGVRPRPAVGVIHRHRHQDHIARGESIDIGRAHRQRQQHDGAMAVQHAFRLTCRARGVEQTSGGVFVEARPNEMSVGLRQPGFVIDRPGQIGAWHVRGIGQHHELVHAGQLRRQRFH